MNTANKLTMVRVVLIPVFLVILYLDARYMALAVFIIASLTDFVDGQIARRYHQITSFGKFMDPLADKALTIAAMSFFVDAGQMPGWALFIVIFREFAVTSLRLVAIESGQVIAAAWSGKVKTACTMVALVVMLAVDSYWVNLACVAVIVVTTAYSGIEYFVKNRAVMSKLNMK